MAKAELLEIQKQQKQQKQEKDALVKKLKQQTEKHEHEKMGLEEEKANLAAQEKAIKSAISLEHQRLAELEAARKKRQPKRKNVQSKKLHKRLHKQHHKHHRQPKQKQSTSSGYSAKATVHHHLHPLRLM
ncbi:hypothetical protein KEH51_05590 [[Brevibacterium] frigoritolerans]|uniref:Uncharacterized protein n=1 Tax=Peribacillus frigoritolerans TaxID=450367 RepID=A0A941J279_9BACI|nr:hypothetical protein [Peribacillus frigoritolerans]